MKRLAPLGLLLALVASALPPALAQEGKPEIKRDDPSTWRWNVPDGPRDKRLIHIAVRSEAMKRDIGVNLSLPSSYEKDPSKRYPVVYFLHGAGGDENSDAGGFSQLMINAVASGRMPSVIGVFPNGALSGYSDWPNDDRVKMETFITKELVPHIDKAYRTQADASKRVIAGFSMGGGGAVRLALRHPDLFSAAASWAGSMRWRAEQGDGSELVKANGDKANGKVKLMMIVGDQDLTFKGHAALVEALKDSGIKYEYRVLGGVPHNLGLYYDKTSDDLAKFLGDALR